ncbi:hypothetical protein PMG71_02125 [Roseofilum sp. BLCC_M154]|uniref:CopG family transcriptional regulator n=1 Tax=Roseofilum acuticapitatum BLCC-M154 TaxID=3022444 RepID=A0ABT7AMV1_9CYAN|nr:hypothetical protein [Roseofilum acuticapitatum]MDJ1168223.1 hypothetical protein [Roseofilum acuticapitatum BLCC-M154]
MRKTVIYFSEQNQQALIEIVHLTGKSEQEVITSAIEELIESYQNKKRLDLMRQARGMWQAREDIPNLHTLREEWDR